MGCLDGNDFGADPDQDPDPGILAEFLTLLDGENVNFAGSSALAESCSLRVPLVCFSFFLVFSSKFFPVVCFIC